MCMSRCPPWTQCLPWHAHTRRQGGAAAGCASTTLVCKLCNQDPAHLHPLAPSVSLLLVSRLQTNSTARTDGWREGRGCRGARVDHAGLRKRHEDGLPRARRCLTGLTGLPLSVCCLHLVVGPCMDCWLVFAWGQGQLMCTRGLGCGVAVSSPPVPFRGSRLCWWRQFWGRRVCHKGIMLVAGRLHAQCWAPLGGVQAVGAMGGWARSAPMALHSYDKQSPAARYVAPINRNTQ